MNAQMTLNGNVEEAAENAHGNMLECKVCEHRWFRRSLKLPKNCPNCGSTFWRVGRQRPPRKESLAKAQKRRIEELKEQLKRNPEIFQKLRPGRMPMYKFAGKISAGEWREVIEDEDQKLYSDIDLLDWHNSDYLMVIDGDCLSGDGIYNGDVVHVQPDLEPETNDIVCVQGVDTQNRFFATCKHIHFLRNGLVELRPSNPDYPIIQAKKGSYVVEGVVISAVRRNLRGRKRKSNGR